jgi:hypothetical protein
MPSVDHTDARKATVRRFGRSDRSKLAYRITKWAQSQSTACAHRPWRTPEFSGPPRAGPLRCFVRPRARAVGNSHRRRRLPRRARRPCSSRSRDHVLCAPVPHVPVGRTFHDESEDHRGRSNPLNEGFLRRTAVCPGDGADPSDQTLKVSGQLRCREHVHDYLQNFPLVDESSDRAISL